MFPYQNYKKKQVVVGKSSGLQFLGLFKCLWERNDKKKCSKFARNHHFVRPSAILRTAESGKDCFILVVFASKRTTKQKHREGESCPDCCDDDGRGLRSKEDCKFSAIERPRTKSPTQLSSLRSDDVARSILGRKNRPALLLRTTGRPEG